MEGKDVAQLITAIAAPAMAGFLVHQLGRRLTFQRAAMDTFHRLVKNVNDFRLALIANQAHSLNGAKVMAGYDAINKLIDDAKKPTDIEQIKLYGGIREKWLQDIRDEEQRCVHAIRALRDSTAAIKADMLMVKMIFGEKARSVIDRLGELLAMGDIFDTIKTSGKYPEFEECRHLPYDGKIAQIDADVETLWERTVKRDLDDLGTDP